MRSVRLLTTLAVGACSLIGVAGGSASAAPPQRCSEGGNRILFSYGDLAIIKSDDGSLLTCTPDLAQYGALAFPHVWFPVPGVDLNQTTVGYTRLDDDGLVINSLKVGENRNEFWYFQGVPYRRVGSLRVWPEGQVAWITCGPAMDVTELEFPLRVDPRPNCVRPGPSMKRVFLFTPTSTSKRVRQLARSRGIDPRSLRRSGQMFTWRDRGHRRVAMIP
jgi:hypothetical protein